MNTPREERGRGRGRARVEDTVQHARIHEYPRGMSKTGRTPDPKSCNVCVKSHRTLTPDKSLTKKVLLKNSTDLCMGRRPIYKSDEFFKSTSLVDQIYLDMTAVAAEARVGGHLKNAETCHLRTHGSFLTGFFA